MDGWYPREYVVCPMYMLFVDEMQTEVYTSAWTLTHDEANFTEPYKFKPERWLPGTEDTLEASQPFSLGTRGCLGRK